MHENGGIPNIFSSFQLTLYQMVSRMLDDISIYSFLSYVGKRENSVKISTEVNYTHHVYPLLG